MSQVGTSVHCECGHLMDKICYKSAVYAHQCDKCQSWRSDIQYMYYCKSHDVVRYRQGYYMCTSCVNTIESRGSRVRTRDEREDNFMDMFKNGWMWKGGKYNAAWKHRYFELNGVLKTLTYYVQPQKATGPKYKMQGFIDFKQTPIIKMTRGKKEEEFYVTTRKRNWAFKCDNKQQSDAWFTIIESLCTQA